MVINVLRIGMIFCVWLGFAACEMDAKTGRGFTLPEGDVSQGKAAFIRLDCVSCHMVVGADGLRDGITEPIMTVPLGGKKMRLYTYGELVTSIINPSHKISQRYKGEAVVQGDVSAMRNYNDVMTVTDLVNITTFLETHYELEGYTSTRYSALGDSGE